jgi:hypothetical protein
MMGQAMKVCIVGISGKLGQYMTQQTLDRGYATGTAQAVLDHAQPGARLVFSCGWHISRDGHDRHSPAVPRQGRAAGLRRPGWRARWTVSCRAPSAQEHQGPPPSPAHIVGAPTP